METELNFDHPIALSDRVLDIPKSATLAINEISKQLILEGKDVVRLGLGQSPFPVPQRLVDGLKAYAASKDYMAVQGYLPLREAIASYIQHSEGLDASADDIIIGPGSKELLFDLQMALDCDLVLPAPSWVSYDPQARLLGRNVHWLDCAAEDGWKLNANRLQQHCEQHRGRQQLLILNSPNNPSGACFNEQELKALAEVAARYNVIVLSDEIYSELHYQGEHVSIARYYPEGTIISNGISKWAGAGGWRLGFFCFPKLLNPLLKSMVVIASETFTSVSAPIQMAAISAFEGSDDIQQYILACRQIMHYCGTHFTESLQQQALDVVMPEGGFYNLTDFSPHRQKLLKHGITNAGELSQQLLQHTGIAALPASDFGIHQGLLLRFAFVDFDGAHLITKHLKDPTGTLHQHTSELEHLFSAPARIGAWLGTL